MWRSEEALIDQTVNQLRMTDYIKRPVGTYSLGMRQRLCFADADRDRHALYVDGRSHEWVGSDQCGIDF